MRLILGFAIILFANMVLAADAPIRKQSQRTAIKANVENPFKLIAAKPVKFKARPLGQMKKIVVMPTMTEGAKRVKMLQSEHKANAVMAAGSSKAGQLREADKNLRQLAHINSINGNSFSNTWIVPGAAYVIRGWGFGTTPGEVKLIGGFPNGPPKFRIDLWQDNVIHAYLEDTISGAYDQENATIAISAPGILWTRDNVKFFAAREVREFDVGPYFDGSEAEQKDNIQIFTKKRTTSRHNGFFRVEGRMDWWVDVEGGTRSSDYCTRAPTIFRTGWIDEFSMTNFKPGWSTVGLEWYVGQTSSIQDYDYQGNPGMSGSWSFDFESEVAYKVVEVKPTKITINWAVFNSVTEKPCSEKNPGFSTTEYEIKGFAEGPRGTAIF